MAHATIRGITVNAARVPPCGKSSLLLRFPSRALLSPQKPDSQSVSNKNFRNSSVAKTARMTRMPGKTARLAGGLVQHFGFRFGEKFYIISTSLRDGSMEDREDSVEFIDSK